MLGAVKQRAFTGALVIGVLMGAWKKNFTSFYMNSYLEVSCEVGWIIVSIWLCIHMSVDCPNLCVRE